MPGPDRGGALAGVVVVELSRTFAGQMAGGVLADLGATVIAIEPRGGSPLRTRGPAIAGEDSLYFQSENRGKYSVEADLSALSTEPWLARLLATADALVEDLGPGELEVAGLAPDALEARNPRLVVLRISPFGQTGPLAGERGDDRIAQAFSGVQFATGFPDRPPIPVTVPLAEAWTGIHGASALLMAIFHARRSGQGQVVDVALYETALRMQEDVVVRYDRTGAVTARMGTESLTVVPANVYPTRDGGWIAVSGAGDQPFARLCEAVEAPDAPRDPRFTTPTARLAHRAAADALVAGWIAGHDLAEVEARFAAVGVTGTAVRSVDEIIADPHVKAREDLLSLRSHSGQDFLAPAPVPKLARTPAAPATSAPKLGEHTDLVRSVIDEIAARPRVRASSSAAGGAWGPLAGIRVLDLSQWLAGPAAAAILADFGADVIMVELPSAGAADGQGRGAPGFAVTNRNKRSVTLDVRAPHGREVFLDLARQSDVIVENFRPGTLERYGLAPATLHAVNSRLVILRSSGFGQNGPYAARAAFNPVGLAFGGMTYLNGWPDRPPIRDGVTAGDYSTALWNVLGVLAALLRRDLDGEGQVVDTAMFECALRLTGDTLAARSALGIRRGRAGGDWPLFPASVTVEAADGRFVTASTPSWSDVAAALERLGHKPGDDAARMRSVIAELVGAMPAADAAQALRQAGLPATTVNSVADLVREPHLWSRGALLRLSHPDLGDIVTQGVVPALSRTPGRVTGWSRAPGSDNVAVLGGLLGYTPEQIRVATGLAG
ncbi:MAG TPA: CoA transferase [Candidatus Methylomirabilis sp.]|nr:CoA transferase [Candidatus Methylomirabilis sp.]